MDNNVIITICLCLGVACWCVSAYFAISHRKDLKSVIRFTGLGVFASLFFFIYPFAVVESGLFAVPFALLQVMASAVVASDPLAIFEALKTEYTVSFMGLYQTILIVLHVIAPLFTIGITLSFFESKFASLLYGIRSRYRESHIFSEVNERTLCLAESIYASNKKSVFVFIGEAEKLEEKHDFAERVRAVGGHILDVAPCDVKHSLKKTRTYYLLGSESGRNLKDAIHLFEKYDKVGGDKIKIWLYSKDEVSAVIFDNLDEKIDIRLINEEKLIAMDLMRSYPLYRGIKDNKLVFLLLGGGHIGLEILRTALWCATFDETVETEFYVLDLNADYSARKFEKMCPGVAEQYNVKFYNANVETAEFTQIVKKLKPTYVAATLGQEQRNIAACAEMRRIYGFDRGFPLIHVLIDNQDTASMILGNMHISDWSFSKEKDGFKKKELCHFSLLPFGSYAETYSSVRFSKGYYDMLAMAINAVHCGITEADGKHDSEFFRELLNKVEFYKDFSYAYATAIPYKLWLMGLSLADDGMGDITALEEELPRFEKTLIWQEEKRWTCYMRANGWQPMDIGEMQGGLYQDKLRKRHVRLKKENEAELSRLVGRNFAEENRRDIYRIPTIIRLANSLNGRPYSVVRTGKEVN